MEKRMKKLGTVIIIIMVVLSISLLGCAGLLYDDYSYSDGSYSSPTNTTPNRCSRCLGSGVCNMCNGSGIGPLSGEQEYACVSCGGSGRCTDCYGRGYK